MPCNYQRVNGLEKADRSVGIDSLNKNNAHVHARMRLFYSRFLASGLFLFFSFFAFSSNEITIWARSLSAGCSSLRFPSGAIPWSPSVMMTALFSNAGDHLLGQRARRSGDRNVGVRGQNEGARSGQVQCCRPLQRPAQMLGMQCAQMIPAKRC